MTVEMDQMLDVLDCARKFKRGFIDLKAVEIGIHDPELDREAAIIALNEGRIQLFAALAVIDGPVPHEQNVGAVVSAEFGEWKATGRWPWDPK